MKILHLDLKTVQGNYVEFRYFLDNPNHYESRRLCLTEIADLIGLVEQDYYVALPESGSPLKERIERIKLNSKKRGASHFLTKHTYPRSVE